MNSLIKIYGLLCLIYIIVLFRKADSKKNYKIIIIIFFPVFGMLLLIIQDIIEKLVKKVDTEQILDLSDESESLDFGTIRKIDYENEINIIPIDDVLSLNSNSVKRKMIFEILKEDTITYMGYLEKALGNSDTETSHYAATTVLEIQNKFNKALQDFDFKYEKSKDNLEVLLKYSEVLKKYVTSSLIDQKSQLKYKNIYSRVLEDILNIEPTEETFIDKINCELELGNFNTAMIFCNRFLKLYPECENAFIMLMKYYYVMYDFKGFSNTLSALKASDIRFSNRGLNITRYWRSEQ